MVVRITATPAERRTEIVRYLEDGTDPSPEALHEPLDDDSPLAAASQQDAHDAQRDLMGLLQSLPDKQRRPIECVKIEGLSVAAPGFGDHQLPIAIAVIVGLFVVQERGTERVAALSG